MDRLRIFLCLGLSFVAVRASAAPMQPSTAPSGVVAVAGDVVRPNTYTQSPQQRLCLRDVLASAGMISERASVLILRPSGGLMQSTEIFVRGAVDQGSQLNPGDVVVVQAVGQADAAAARTAAIVVGDQSLVLSLQDATVTVGDTLAELQIAPQLAEHVQLISIIPGRSRRNISYAERLQHGDILVVGRSVGATGRASGGFSPQVSEWSSGRIARPEDRPAPPVDVHSAPLGPGPFTTPGNPHDPLGFLQPPDTFAPDVTSGAATSDRETSFHSAQTLLNRPTNASDHSATHPFRLPPQSGLTAAQTVTESMDPGSVRDPFLPADYQAGDQTAAIRLIRASLQTSPPEVESDADAAAIPPTGTTGKPEIAPAPPAESPQSVTSAAAGYGLWNILFVGGLLTAGGLIIVGWLKSEAEFQQHETQEKLQRSVHAGLAAAAAPSSAPATPEPQQTPAASSGLSALPTFVSTPAVFESVPQAVTAPVSVQPEGTDPLVSPHEWLGGDWRTNTDRTHETSVRAERSSAHQALDQWRDSLPPLTSDGDGETDVRELTDLIENRVPVDLCETRLPLQIRLHGRPSGPRKLRIDAAHTTLAGPHTHVAAEHRQADSPVVAGERSPERRAEGGGLDRALNFLHEQGE